MIKADLPEFQLLLDRCARVLGPLADWIDPETKAKLTRPPADVVDAYWSALKDLPLDVFRRSIESHLKRGKWFPRPFQLRPKDDGGDRMPLSADGTRSCHLAMLELARTDPANYGRLPGIFETNRQNWSEFRAQDPELAEIEFMIAQWGRLLVTERFESPQYAEAVREDRRARDAWRELMERRRVAAGAA